MREQTAKPWGGPGESRIVLTALIVLGVYLISSFFSHFMPVIRAIN